MYRVWQLEERWVVGFMHCPLELLTSDAEGLALSALGTVTVEGLGVAMTSTAGVCGCYARITHGECFLFFCMARVLITPVDLAPLWFLLSVILMKA